MSKFNTPAARSSLSALICAFVNVTALMKFDHTLTQPLSLQSHVM
ncbi:hypothetical protein [uncultured Allobaculum sp.]|nr:hypothetical protein [uncultured Allobaculum sp.]